ncbi:MFS transporter [Streptomyces goshikiensis]|uniref:MFS transporter n=1 Tax=Streptomyces TaxID=1883 RepID=UPI00093CC92B|nr:MULTISPECIES: MFS transporter [Streptomyces]MBP0938135.1 MFS transporter [Streptomyces sp. KCTC 0041BP]OKI40435.1 MFS transporter [Streptomyces sp. CB03578]PJN19642.1 MFS transporter [Streptomyces sp. CB02120-2]
MATSTGKERVGDVPSGLWRHRDFRNLWLGQTSSMFAAHMVAVIFPLLASVSLNASLFEMGLLSAAGYVPYIGVSLFAGVWLDRKPKRAIIVLCDIARALLLLAIPIAWWLDLLSVPTLLVVALLVGCFSVVADVGSASILPALVERDDLIEGNSKLELSASSASIAGSALGGGIFQLLAGPVSMLINTVLFALSAFFTALIRGERKGAEGSDGTQGAEGSEEGAEAGQSIWRDMADGVAFVTGHVTVRTLVLTTLIINFFMAIAEPVALVFVTRTLDIPPYTVGLILAASGAGALVGAVIAAPMSRLLPLGRLLVLTATLTGVASLLTPLATLVPAPAAVALMVAMYVLDAAMIVVYNINVRSYRSAITPDEMQGRMNATNRMAGMGVMPIGAVLGGLLGTAVGTLPALVLASLGTLIAPLVLACSHVRTVKRVPVPQPEAEPTA